MQKKGRYRSRSTQLQRRTPMMYNLYFSHDTAIQNKSLLIKEDYAFYPVAQNLGTIKGCQNTCLDVLSKHDDDVSNQDVIDQCLYTRNRYLHDQCAQIASFLAFGDVVKCCGLRFKKQDMHKIKSLLLSSKFFYYKGELFPRLLGGLDERKDEDLNHGKLEINDVTYCYVNDQYPQYVPESQEKMKNWRSLNSTDYGVDVFITSNLPAIVSSLSTPNYMPELSGVPYFDSDQRIQNRVTLVNNVPQDYAPELQIGLIFKNGGQNQQQRSYQCRHSLYAIFGRARYSGVYKALPYAGQPIQIEQLKDAFQIMRQNMDLTQLRHLSLQLSDYYQMGQANLLLATLPGHIQAGSSGCSIKTIMLKAWLDFFGRYNGDSVLANNHQHYVRHPVGANNTNVQLINRNNFDAYYANLTEIQKGTKQLIFCPETAINMMNIRHIVRWNQNYPYDKYTLDANRSLTPTSLMFDIPSELGLILWTDHNHNLQDIPAPMQGAHVTTGSILNAIRYLLQTYGQYAVQDCEWAMKYAAWLSCGVHTDVITNLIPGTQQDARYIAGTFNNVKIQVPVDNTAMSIVLPLLKIENATKTHQHLFQSANKLARQMLMIGMALTNVTSITLQQLNITIRQLDHFAGHDDNDIHQNLIIHEENILYEDDDYRSLFKDYLMMNSIAIYNLNIPNNLLQCITHREQMNTIQSQYRLGVQIVPNYLPALTTMFDTWYMMKKIWLGQLHAPRGETIKYSDHQGNFIAHDQRDVQNILKIHEPVRNLGIFNFIIEGGVAYNAKFFLNSQLGLVRQNIAYAHQLAEVPIPEPRIIIDIQDGMFIEYPVRIVEYDQLTQTRQQYVIQNNYAIDDIDREYGGTYIYDISVGGQEMYQWIIPGAMQTKVNDQAQKTGRGSKLMSRKFGNLIDNVNSKIQDNQKLDHINKFQGNSTNNNVPMNTFGHTIYEKIDPQVEKEFNQLMKTIVIRTDLQKRIIEQLTQKVGAYDRISHLHAACFNHYIGPLDIDYIHNRYSQQYLDEKVSTSIRTLKFDMSKQPEPKLLTDSLTISNKTGIYNIDPKNQKIQPLAPDIKTNEIKEILEAVRVVQNNPGLSEYGIKKVQINQSAIQQIKMFSIITARPEINFSRQVHAQYHQQKVIDQYKKDGNIHKPTKREGVLEGKFCAKNKSEQWARIIKMTGYHKEGYSSSTVNFRELQGDWIGRPCVENASYSVLREVHLQYYTNFIDRQLLAQWRYCFAPGSITSEDLSYLPEIYLQQWQEIFDDARTKKLSQNKPNTPKHQEIFTKWLLYRKGKYNQEAIDFILDLHPNTLKTKDTRLKMTLKQTILCLRKWMITTETCVQDRRSLHNVEYMKKRLLTLKQIQFIIKLLFTNNGWSAIAVMGHIIAFMGDQYYREQIEFIDIIKLTKMNINDYISISKKVHNQVRKGGIWYDGKQLSCRQRVGYQYLQDLAGRGDYEIDIESELELRTKQNCMKVHPDINDPTQLNCLSFRKMRDHMTYKMFKGLKIDFESVLPYKDYLDSRVQWSKSGSCVGAKVRDGKDMIRLNKRGALQQITTAMLQHITDSMPITVTSTAHKIENSKTRLILPGSLGKYLVDNYICTPVENALSNNPDIGLAKDCEHKLLDIGEIRQLSIKGTTTMCFDFDNFNGYHTAEDMSSIFDILKQVSNESTFKDTVKEEYISKADWVMRSQLNMFILLNDQELWQLLDEKYRIKDGIHKMYNIKVEYPDISKVIREELYKAGLSNINFEKAIAIVQGLFSGLRYTDLVNTIMNYIQLKMVEMMMQKMMQIEEPLLIKQKHKGDDLAAFSQGWIESVMMNVGCRLAGHIGNDSKVLIDEGTIEFLRNLIQQDGIWSGYIKRGIPNLCCKDQQGTENEKIDAEQFIIGIYSQIKKLVI